MIAGDNAETSVQVAVRIRPQNAREQIDMCRVCTFCTPDVPQIILGKDKAFTYDFVFDTATFQEHLYSTCVEDLVSGCFDGYNATVLAYGQTGSGKTYTMGTGFDMAIVSEELGVIPRAVQQIFTGIEERRAAALEKNEQVPQFEVKTEFLELYNEEIIDLFDEQNKKKLQIHEDSLGFIYVSGATELSVSSEEETLDCLKRGALSRTVGSTNMNASSSRSHAIFSLHIIHQRYAVKDNDAEPSEESPQVSGINGSSNSSDWETLKAKFHFVDLAGSERLKRTGATGERAKEGISINCGLLALGNVISALGDKAKKGNHVPYRDSKLTRLLQDSLGGNSKTLMIACISPTDRDFMETLNTLKYSNRARNIKNKVVVNQDKMSRQLTSLRSKIHELEVELLEFKSGRMVVSEDGSVVMNDMTNEITMLRTENDKLRLRVKAMQNVIVTQTSSVASLTAWKEVASMGHQDESTGQVLANSSQVASNNQFTNVIQGYITEIEELKSRLIISDCMARARKKPPSDFRRASSTILEDTHISDRIMPGTGVSVFLDAGTGDLLKLAKNNIEKLKEKGKKEILEDTRTRAVRRSAKSSLASGEVTPRVRIGSAVPVIEFIEGDSSNEESSDDGSDDTVETVPHPTSSEDSESGGEESSSLASSIAELSSEINLKQQLVDQLEKAQKSFQTMKSQYEEKMHVLQLQIRSIEAERDKVLKDITTRRSAGRTEENVKEVKTKYEKQLCQLKTELKGLKSAKKEHAKALQKNAQHERDLKLLKTELLDMKKQRVKMLNKMRLDANQKKIDDAKRTNEIRQLQKEHRTKDHKIKILQSDAKRKELVLKRRQEELSSLRREKRHKLDRPKSAPQTANNSTTLQGAVHNGVSESATAAAVLPSFEPGPGCGAAAVSRKLNTHDSSNMLNVVRTGRRKVSSLFSSESAKKKWRNLEKRIMDAVMKRQTMANLAKDMDMWIEKRDKLSLKVDDLRRQKEAIVKTGGEELREIARIDEDMDSLSAHVEYVQENIVELQNDLITVDDVKCDGDTFEAHTIINSSTLKESKYLLEHLLDVVLNLGVKASQRENDVKSLAARLKASQQSAEIMQSLSSPQVSYPTLTRNRTTSKLKSLTQCLDLHPHSLSPLDKSSAVDRESDKSGCSARVPNVNHCRRALVSTDFANEGSSVDPSSSTVSTSTANTDQEKSNLKSSKSSKEKDNALTDDQEKVDEFVTSRRRKGSGGSSDFTRKGLKKRPTTSNSSDIQAANGSSRSAVSPVSPNLSNKVTRSAGADSNVWSRLTTSSNTTSDTSKGSIKSESRKAVAGKLLHSIHTASGHAASILSVFATQSYLFSASQDRTVKIWNLKTCTELLTLDKHFSYVRCVRFCPKNNIIFTASQSLIKMWDMRHHRARCINTFGLPTGGGTGSEVAVQDLLVSPSGNTLYSASGNFINIWDLRKSAYQGRFVGHNGAVCALVMKNRLLATGSRDRLIKIYDLETVDPATTVNQASICTLYPPHYDAVSSLAVYKDLMFSSCGVTIKQWDIKERSLKQAVDGAHSQGSTINSLAILNSPLTPLLVSGCKGGFLKLWNPDSCSHIGEIVAHKSSINSIATNGTCIFTGSSDKTIRIWRPSPQDS